jgi:hypothetical protein
MPEESIFDDLFDDGAGNDLFELDGGGNLFADGEVTSTSPFGSPFTSAFRSPFQDITT